MMSENETDDETQQRPQKRIKLKKKRKALEDGRSSLSTSMSGKLNENIVNDKTKKVRSKTNNALLSVNDEITIMPENAHPVPMIDELLWLIMDLDVNEFKTKWNQKLNCLNMEAYKGILSKLCYDENITPSSLKIILTMWRIDKVKHESNDDLRRKRTQLYLDLWKYLLFRLNDRKIKGDKVMSVCCSYKRFKSLFVNFPTYEEVYVMDPINYPVNVMNISMLNIMHWPYFNIEINTINLIMKQVNYHRSNFRLVNIKRDPPQRGYTVKTQLLNNTEDIVHKSYISFIINHVKTVIKHITSLLITDESFNNIRIVLEEFDGKLLLSSKQTSIPQKYYKNIMKYPYYRYFSRDNTNKVQHGSIDVRLEETLIPSFNFEVVKCNVEKLDVKNCELDDYVVSLKHSITVTCVLCNVKFKSLEDMSSILDHIKSHGPEPDWVCTFCNNVFSVEMLTANGWLHTCK